MITLVRVDDRLVHGQVITCWVPTTGADVIVVASDKAASSEIWRAAIACCATDGLAVFVETVEAAVGLVGGEAMAPRRVIVITGSIADALRLKRLGLAYGSLNVGNVHASDGCVDKTPSVCLGPADLDALAGLDALGVSVEYAAVPGVEWRPAGGAGGVGGR